MMWICWLPISNALDNFQTLAYGEERISLPAEQSTCPDVWHEARLPCPQHFLHMQQVRCANAYTSLYCATLASGVLASGALESGAPGGTPEPKKNELTDFLSVELPSSACNDLKDIPDVVLFVLVRILDADVTEREDRADVILLDAFSMVRGLKCIDTDSGEASTDESLRYAPEAAVGAPGVFTKLA
mmetsp:Transcript_611/g.1014  ORF Transcript_611/g.1014 Transcript_611/m.1014 type:complete len:187 (-) Transcript_611:892-1452(-)